MRQFCRRYASRMPKLVNIDESRILRCKLIYISSLSSRKFNIQRIVLADPAAPTLNDEPSTSPTASTSHLVETPISPMPKVSSPITPAITSPVSAPITGTQDIKA